jgi:hypothetical protein
MEEFTSPKIYYDLEHKRIVPPSASARYMHLYIAARFGYQKTFDALMNRNPIITYDVLSTISNSDFQTLLEVTHQGILDKLTDKFAAAGFKGVILCNQITKIDDIKLTKKEFEIGLLTAIRHNRYEFLQKLMEKDPQTFKSLLNTHTLLHYAAKKGNVKILNFILSYIEEQTVNGRDDAEKSPIYYAFCNGHGEAFNILMAHDANCFIPDACSNDVEHRRIMSLGLQWKFKELTQPQSPLSPREAKITLYEWYIEGKVGAYQHTRIDMAQSKLEELRGQTDEAFIDEFLNPKIPVKSEEKTSILQKATGLFSTVVTKTCSFIVEPDLTITEIDKYVEQLIKESLASKNNNQQDETPSTAPSLSN